MAAQYTPVRMSAISFRKNASSERSCVLWFTQSMMTASYPAVLQYTSTPSCLCSGPPNTNRIFLVRRFVLVDSLWESETEGALTGSHSCC